MSWWDSVYEGVHQGSVLNTPGTIHGARRKNFTIIFKDPSVMKIDSGSPIKIPKECFDAIETAFNKNPTLWLRTASIKDNEPLPNSADRLVRDATGSNLSRGHYVCAILEHCSLVKYSRQGTWKVIVLPQR
jgi:hypothetical protein